MVLSAPHGAALRVGKYSPDGGLSLLDVSEYAADGAAAAGACHNVIYVPRQILPDLSACGLIVSKGIGGVLELIEGDGAVDLTGQLLRLPLCAQHTLLTGGVDDLCPQSTQQ